MHSLFGRDRFQSRIFRGLFQLSSGFRSSPSSASGSCSSSHHFSFLCSRFVIRITIRGRPSKNVPHTMLFQQQESCESFARGSTEILRRSQDSALRRELLELVGSTRCTSREPVRLRRNIDLLVRWTKCNQILRVKCAERGRDTRPYS